jgi:hypothetical protein
MTLRELFGAGQWLRLPPLQRPFAWTDKEVGQLFDDVVQAALEHEAIGEDDVYYMGGVVLVHGEREGVFDVVDGQQRLTTITILLAALRDLESEPARADGLHALIADGALPGQGPRWRIALRPMDANFFRDCVQGEGALRSTVLEPAAGITDSEPRERIRSAAVLLWKALAALEPPDRRRLADFLVDNVLFVVLKAHDPTSAYRLFRTQNDRGRDLSPADILKSEFLERAGLTPEETERAGTRWDEMETRLGRASFGSLLSALRTIYIRNRDGEGSTILSDFRRAVLEREDPRQFMDRTLPTCADVWALLQPALPSEMPQPGTVLDTLTRQPHLRYMTLLPQDGWKPVALEAIRRFSERPAVLERVLVRLERLAFGLALNIIPQDRRPRRYRALLRALDAEDAFDDPEGAFALRPEETERMLKAISEPLDQKDLRRALVFRLNAALPEGEGPDVLRARKATVEHILPRGAGERWSGRRWSERDRVDLVNLLGNFCVLTENANKAADALDFDEKRRVYFDRAALRGTADFALTRDLARQEAWIPDIIRQRHNRLVSVLTAAWELL